ncbi:MAG: hypothetical protein GXY41_02745 [Phycisphaerae bacterium]|nr:hypothetical protein [Phycisphaerae bacterium]
MSTFAPPANFSADGATRPPGAATGADGSTTASTDAGPDQYDTAPTNPAKTTKKPTAAHL